MTINLTLNPSISTSLAEDFYVNDRNTVTSPTRARTGIEKYTSKELEPTLIRSLPEVCRHNHLDSSAMSGDLKTQIKALLVPDAQGNVHEEELQYAVVVHLLQAENPEAARYFAAALDKLVGEYGFEDAVKMALQKTVQSNLIALDSAERINGISFRAAQLDDNQTALFDGYGGDNDNTISVLPIDEAAARAQATLNAINSSEIEVQSRSLQAPSNGVPQIATVSEDANPISGLSSAASNGFLWKPISDKDGHLVVLLPPTLTGQVESAGLYTQLPPSPFNLVEMGRFAGDTENGGRTHIRFTKSGDSYPDGVYVIAHLRDGTAVEFHIPEASQRFEQ